MYKNIGDEFGCIQTMRYYLQYRKIYTIYGRDLITEQGTAIFAGLGGGCYRGRYRAEHCSLCRSGGREGEGKLFTFCYDNMILDYI